MEIDKNLIVIELFKVLDIPCLSTSRWSRNVIEVSKEDRENLKTLSNIWYGEYNQKEIQYTKGLKGVERYDMELKAQKETSHLWNNLLLFRYKLKEKYLPHSYTVNINPIISSDSYHVIEYLSDYIYDIDFCDYTFETIYDGEYLIGIKYILNLNKPSSYTGDEWLFDD